jgi:pyridoxamine 5'-phosphate oxidase
MREILRGLPVFPAELPPFDVAAAPDNPVTLFLDWLAAAAAARLLGPQVMTLSTADAAGRVSARVLICKDVEAGGRWSFASDADSGKGRDLAANPWAAGTFYWPQHGRQVRLAGAVTALEAAAGAADFRARHPDSRAAALAGHQSQVLADPAELDAAVRRGRAAVDADPGLVMPSWTLYALTADEAEFWQADPSGQHIRLRYQRAGDGWDRQRLWP